MFTKLPISETLLVDSVVQVVSDSCENEGGINTELDSGESEAQQDCTPYSDASSSLGCPCLFAPMCSSRCSMHLVECRTSISSTMTTCLTSTADGTKQARVCTHVFDFHLISIHGISIHLISIHLNSIHSIYPGAFIGNTCESVFL